MLFTGVVNHPDCRLYRQPDVVVMRSLNLQLVLAAVRLVTVAIRMR